MQECRYDKLRVRRYDSRLLMGQAAGKWGARKIRDLLEKQESVNIVFGAAPSQNEMMSALTASDVDFSRINALQMDEYIGLPAGSPQSFGHYLDEHLFGNIPFRSVQYINTAMDADSMCARYRQILKQYPPDIVFLGIGENGHIAFNDPHVADFSDPFMVKTVSLDEVCRQQQVNDGCFAAPRDVPTHAVTLTIPAMMGAKTLVCTVPAASKAKAVEGACTGDISIDCPASIMRTHDDCVLFCDPDSGKYLARQA